MLGNYYLNFWFILICCFILVNCGCNVQTKFFFLKKNQNIWFNPIATLEECVKWIRKQFCSFTAMKSVHFFATSWPKMYRKFAVPYWGFFKPLLQLLYLSSANSKPHVTFLPCICVFPPFTSLASFILPWTLMGSLCFYSVFYLSVE